MQRQRLKPCARAVRGCGSAPWYCRTPACWPDGNGRAGGPRRPGARPPRLHRSAGGWCRRRAARPASLRAARAGTAGSAWRCHPDRWPRTAASGALRAGARDHGDIVEEAHVEHAVGFVEHQRVERVELQRTALQVVLMRPGVPTAICAPWARLSTCGRIGVPPHKVSTLTLSAPRASRRISCVTCSASSRVGHSTSAWVAKLRASSRCSSASAKAAVLPLPVLACAIRSWPASASGSAAAWIGVMSLTELRQHASVAGDRGRREKGVPSDGWGSGSRSCRIVARRLGQGVTYAVRCVMPPACAFRRLRPAYGFAPRRFAPPACGRGVGVRAALAVPQWLGSHRRLRLCARVLDHTVGFCWMWHAKPPLTPPSPHAGRGSQDRVLGARSWCIVGSVQRDVVRTAPVSPLPPAGEGLGRAGLRWHDGIHFAPVPALTPPQAGGQPGPRQPSWSSSACAAAGARPWRR